MDVSLPKAIGRYEVIRHLGTGAMGFVYLAHDPELEREVAVKTLRDLKIDEDLLNTFLDRFRNEARAAARLKHPAIVQVYDVGSDPDVGPYVVFEYVAGASLKRVLREQGPIPSSDVARLAEQVGEAIDLAHRAGILHRDIKPENLLVTDDGDCKLADFGVARLPDAALTHEGQFLGTPCYAAPETLSRADYSAKSDIFSFGALLYEALSGARAFPGTDALAVAHKVVHEDPPPPSAVAPAGASIPKAVDDLVMSSLAKDPDARPASAGALAADLRRALAGAGLADTVPMGVSRAPKEPGVATRLGHALLALGLLAATAGVVFTLAGPRDNGDPIPTFGLDSGIRDAAEPAVRSADATAHDAHEVDGHIGDAATDAADADASGVGARGEDPEEQAKFALDRARAAIAAGELDEARAALEQARRLDPGNDDIRDIERLLLAATPASDSPAGDGQPPGDRSPGPTHPIRPLP